ncbi:MAG TPA: rod shape-determining protein MreC [Thermodesulfobacteriota bacterium]|nr:rod shape-determining protein MreC [Thermodesulfobacteriota bacterium]
MPQRFAKRNKVSIVFLSLLILSLLLMSIDVKNRGKLSLIDELVVDSTSVVQRGITNSYQSGKGLWSGYIYLSGLRKENLMLKKEAAELREGLNTFREAVQENQRLKELLSFKEGTGYRVVTARVIGISPASFSKTITIGKGSSDGVAKGMAVVTNDGVVGRVLSSSSNASKVLLITDRNSDVDAVAQRSRDRGIAEGEDSGLLQLKYFPRSADALEGDLIVTSGIGGVFQKGLVIGSISRLDKDIGGIFQYAEIRPSVNFSKLEEVLVITESPDDTGG